MSSFTPEQLSEPFYKRHRGPFRLQVTRPFVTKPGFYRTEVLKGSVDGPDVEDEANALMNDTRDTIIGVSVWSEKEEQFIFGFQKKGVENERETESDSEVA